MGWSSWGSSGTSKTPTFESVIITPTSASETPLLISVVQSTAPLGDELVSNGDFSTVPDTSWTWGNGWTHDTTNHEADHTTGYTDPLTQDITVTNGETYQIEFTIKNRTAGEVKVDIGGVYVYNYGSNTLFSDNTTYKRSFVANTTGTATLSITPTSGFDGSIDNVTVKQIIGGSQPNVTWYDDQGNVFGEVRGKSSLGNLFIGYGAGYNNTTGHNNTFLGYYAGSNNTAGDRNTFLGYQAGYNNTTGYRNTFLGNYVGYRNTTGYRNTFLGDYAGYNNTTGYRNTFLGGYAGYNNTTGDNNTFLGYQAGYGNTTGHYNTFLGGYAGYNNTTGNYNAFLGFYAGYGNTTGSFNTFLGYYAGYRNTTGYSNTFLGYYAGYGNTTGSFNTFLGNAAGFNNAAGSFNTFLGYYAGSNNTAGDRNTFLGYQAGYNNTTGYSNTFLGYYVGYRNTTGYRNTFLGDYAGYNVNQKNDAVNSIAIGYNTYTTKNNQVVIGNTDIVETLLRGNIGINTDQFGSGQNVLAIGNATTLPSTNPVDAVILFAKDFDDGDGTATSELFVRDEDGNETNLSPHAIELYRPASDDPLPFTYNSTNPLIGKKVNVDLSGAIRELEKLTGKKFIHVVDIPKVSLDEFLKAKKELLIKKYQEENATEVEITLEEAIEEIEVEVDDPENIVGEKTRYRFENGEIIEEKIPVYGKKKEIRKRIKQGVRFDEETGKFYKKVLPTREEAEKAIADSPKLKLRKWIIDRIEEEGGK